MAPAGDRRAAPTAAYLARLGAPPDDAATLDRLFALHRAHVERVPYETFWLHLDEGWDIDPLAAARRIASGRGGYCFHLNGAFADLLDALGYRVTRHVAGVHDKEGPRADAMGNHLALVVHGLPTDGNPAGAWYVDTGLGDVLFEPLPLTDGDYEQGPQHYRIRPVHPQRDPTSPVGDWHFANLSGGSLAGVSLDTARVVSAVPARFETRHRFNVTSPASSYARTVTAQRRDRHGVDLLRGCVLTRRERASTSQALTSRRAWLDALHDVFDLTLQVPPGAVEALWRRVSTAHEHWVSTDATAAARH